ncbi:MAG: Diverged AAA-family ATPase containing protein [Parcubacteria group bacterium GW2011_GWA2_42_14]|nr:MAG: Diverged AAA-family ATPase containing protein [Parcubacteria group bacterium GW2011_GWA2_42_14]
MDKENILNEITSFYLNSRDFNGISIEDLYKKSSLLENKFKEKITALIKNRKIDLIYEGDIPNPHIKPFPAPAIEKQIEKLHQFQIDDHIKQSEVGAETFGEGDIKIKFVQGIGCCVYPAPDHLKNIVDWKKYISRPFTLRLAMGEWQLRPYFFELGILAIYRNDPRYKYRTDDITGSIIYVDEKLLNPSDQIFIEHFGFGFGDSGIRAVAILLTDLAKLTPEHQQIWKAKMLGGYYKYRLHPEFRRSILGDFYEKESIFSAFLKELEIIKEMSEKIGGISLINKTFEYDEKPENFGFLILPTLREYELFCHTLDRMMSDNLNKEFFKDKISESDLSDGETMEKIDNQLIRKLEIWINKTVRFSDHGPKDEMFKTFREIRGLRSKPAHSHFKNEWNLRFYEDQKKLIKQAYTAIRTLRLILANHRNTKSVEVPDWLFKGEIRTF